MTRYRNHLQSVVLTAVYLGVLYSLELTLAFLPNIQVTTVLFAVFAVSMRYKYTFMLTVGYVVLNAITYGVSIYLIPMYLAWLSYTALVFTLKSKKVLTVAIFSGVYGLLYGMYFVPFNVLLTGVDFWAYVLADIPFGLIFATSNFVTVLWIYEPMCFIFSKVRTYDGGMVL